MNFKALKTAQKEGQHDLVLQAFRADHSLAADSEAFKVILRSARATMDFPALLLLAARMKDSHRGVSLCQRIAQWSYDLDVLEVWQEAIALREKIGRDIRLTTLPIAPADVAFAHVPKCAGLSLKNQKGIVSIGHRLIADGQCSQYLDWFSLNFPSTVPIPKEAFVCINVRNIFAWLVSYFYAVTRFTKTLQSVNDARAAAIGFDYLLKSIAERDRPWPSGSLSIFLQAYSYPSGLLRANWINRIETLQDDISALCRFRGLKPITVPHKNPASNRRSDYRSFYTDRLVDLVHETWRQDLAVFGFTFDGYSGGLHREADLPRQSLIARLQR